MEEIDDMFVGDGSPSLGVDVEIFDCPSARSHDRMCECVF